MDGSVIHEIDHADPGLHPRQSSGILGQLPSRAGRDQAGPGLRAGRVPLGQQEGPRPAPRWSTGDFAEALASDRKTYGSFKEQFGADYPRTLSAAHNLACSLRVAGDCFAASDLDHDTLERRLCVLGSGHPYTLGSAANLAPDMREAGAFRDSADLLRGTWQKYRTVLGDEIIDTLRAAASLAISLGQQPRHLPARRRRRCQPMRVIILLARSDAARLVAVRGVRPGYSTVGLPSRYVRPER